MDKLRGAARRLLADKIVNVVIGFSEGSSGRVRACFITDAANADQLIFDDRCKENLAHFLVKPEVRHLGKAAIVARVPVMRTILMLVAEQQVKEENVIVLGIGPDGQVLDIPNYGVMENFLLRAESDHPVKEKELIATIRQMNLEQRFLFWKNELDRCIKCYACRAACPLCFCTRCTAECNQPQWVSVPSHIRGNVEWHVLRAMHLAGRCISCGDCSRSCPMDIPIAVLPMYLADVAQESFGTKAGLSATMPSVLSTFKPNDKENFIR
jgi:formate dehydrogenase subunit beta